MNDISKLDQAVLQAKNRVAEQNGQTPGEPKPKRTRLTDEERTARAAALELQRAEKKEARATKKAEKLAAYEAGRKPAHLAKVQKAAEKLPAMGESSQGFFDELTSNLEAADVFSLAANLNHWVRAKQTELALSANVNTGDKVRILSGHPRFIGQTGTVSKAQRIRCLVTVEGYDKEIYLFTSDVEVTEAAPIKTVPADNAEPAQATG